MFSKYVLFIGLYAGIWHQAIGQSEPFTLYLEPVKVEGLVGLQSYAIGQAEDKWLVIGGRLDGLHRRQPWASFDVAGHNNQLIVVSPLTGETWYASIAGLATSIQEQLMATNINFYQEEDFLYCIGGYGYSPTAGDHTTFPYLTIIDVPAVIQSIIQDTDITPHIRQIMDNNCQVTGGRLRKINDIFYLLGGQKFIGRYNPMNNPTFTQQYTDQIRRFTIDDDGANIKINWLEAYTDEANLHRRDYNAEAQILPDGREGITMFSGVFRRDKDLPFLNAVTVSTEGYQVDNTFTQYYNHYHCASVPLYSAHKNEMHTLFFGGIAQFYEKNGQRIQDDNVPFVKSVSRVTRDSLGVMTEHLLPLEMPDYLGAGAEFILNRKLPHYDNEVLDLDQITQENTLIGYIFGGIHSQADNIFWVNDGTQSNAYDQVLKVYINPSTVATHELYNMDLDPRTVVVKPNPSSGQFSISYDLTQPTDVRISIYDSYGRVKDTHTFLNQDKGSYQHTYDRGDYITQSIQYVCIKTNHFSKTVKMYYE